MPPGHPGGETLWEVTCACGTEEKTSDCCPLSVEFEIVGRKDKIISNCFCETKKTIVFLWPLTSVIILLIFLLLVLGDKTI